MKDFKIFLEDIAGTEVRIKMESKNIFFIDQKKKKEKSGIRRFTIFSFWHRSIKNRLFLYDFYFFQLFYFVPSTDHITNIVYALPFE